MTETSNPLVQQTRVQEIDPRAQAERHMSRPAATQAGELSLITRRGNEFIIPAGQTHPETVREIQALRTAVEEYRNEKGKVEMMASLYNQALDIIKELNQKIQAQQPLTEQDKTKFDQLTKVLNDLVEILPENIKSSARELLNKGSFAELMDRVEQHIKESDAALERKIQEINELAKIPPRTPDSFYDALRAARGCSDVTFSDAAANAARDHYNRAFYMIGRHVNLSELPEDSVIRRYSSLAEINYNGQRTKVLGIDALYIEKGMQGFPSTSKALDPRIAKAWEGFVRVGVCNPDTKKPYSDQELMRLWGFDNEKDFRFAKRHLYGSIREEIYYKMNFSGLESISVEEERNRVAAELARDADKLWKAHRDNGNKFWEAVARIGGAVAPHLLENSRGDKVLFVGLTAYLTKDLPPQAQLIVSWALNETIFK